MSEKILALIDLQKKFKDVLAVDKVSFEINKGEIFGLLGPNGAGKTTIIKMLCTLLNPTNGTAKVNGYDIITDRDSVRKSIGVVFQDPSTDEELTAYENLVFHGRIYGIELKEMKKRITTLLKMVELYDKKDKLVKQFSGGMKRRLEIARGLMHHPKVLFLDEPTTGLDPQTRTKIWNYIKNLNEKEDITIILTTHYMDEADKLCSKVGIIDHGKVITIDKPKDLKENLKGDTVTIGVTNPNKLKNALKDVKGINKLTCHENSCTINIKNAENSIPMLFRVAEGKNLRIESITLHKPTLEDVFLHFTGRKIREQSAEGFAAKVRMMRRR